LVGKALAGGGGEELPEQVTLSQEILS